MQELPVTTTIVPAMRRAQRWPDELLDTVAERFPSVQECDEDDLFALWVAVSLALQRKDRVRSLGNVPADLAELIVEKLVGGKRTRGSTVAVDVIGPDGETRYQVKSLRRTDPGRNSVGTLPGFQLFDHLIVIVFEYDLSICLGLRASANDLSKHRTELLTGRDHRRLSLTRKFCSHRIVTRIPQEQLARHHPAPALAEWTAPRWYPDSDRTDLSAG